MGVTLGAVYVAMAMLAAGQDRSRQILPRLWHVLQPERTLTASRMWLCLSGRDIAIVFSCYWMLYVPLLKQECPSTVPLQSYRLHKTRPVSCHKKHMHHCIIIWDARLCFILTHVLVCESCPFNPMTNNRDDWIKCCGCGRWTLSGLGSVCSHLSTIQVIASENLSSQNTHLISKLWHLGMTRLWLSADYVSSCFKTINGFMVPVKLCFVGILIRMWPKHILILLLRNPCAKGPLFTVVLATSMLTYRPNQVLTCCWQGPELV